MTPLTPLSMQRKLVEKHGRMSELTLYKVWRPPRNMEHCFSGAMHLFLPLTEYRRKEQRHHI